jgi:aspartate aminotransferase-like enzyme
MAKFYLMTPGPTQVPEEVLLAQAKPLIHHRSPAYAELLKEAIKSLAYVFQTKGDVLLFTSSGTGAMESAVANLFSLGDKVLVISTGKFGERWVEICQAFGLEVVEEKVEWGKPADPALVGKALNADAQIKGVLVTHSETSTGVVNKVKEMAQYTKDRQDVVFIVDAVSSLGACELRMDDWGLDVVVSGSQKALMAPPGLSFVALSEKAWSFAEKSTLPKYYWDYKKYKKSFEKSVPQNPFTPAIATVLALAASLRLIREEGLENVWKRHVLLGRATRAGVKALGLELFSPDDDSSSAVTAVLAPSQIDAGEIVKLMRKDHNVWIAGGQASLKGKIFRIGHCGYYTPIDIIVALSCLERVLLKLGVQVELGKSLQAAQQVFAEAGL